MAFTNENLKDRVAGNQKVDPASLPPFWDLVIPPANAAAYGDVRRALTERGYSAAQIDAWDDLAEFQGDIGLFWALVDFLGAAPYDAMTRPAFEHLDRRAELAAVPVTIGGVLVAPDNALTLSPVGHGKMRAGDDEPCWQDGRRAGRGWNRGLRW